MNITTLPSNLTSAAGAAVAGAPAPPTAGIGARHTGQVRRAFAAAAHIAMTGVIAAAPAINLYWCVGLPPYDSAEQTSR